MINATEARKGLFELIRRALYTHQPVHIRHREGQVVMLAQEDYEALIETLELLSVPGFRDSLVEAEEDVATGRTSSFDEVFGRGGE